MTDLDNLYQEVILDHYKAPRNFGRLENADRAAEGHNPLCGDRLKVYLKLTDGRVGDLKFEGAGCAISTASASMMTDAAKGKSAAEIGRLAEKFLSMAKGEGRGDGLDKLEAFAGVSEFPVRVKCATLAWHTLRAALEGSQQTVSTEE